MVGGTDPPRARADPPTRGPPTITPVARVGRRSGRAGAAPPSRRQAARGPAFWPRGARRPTPPHTPSGEGDGGETSGADA